MMQSIVKSLLLAAALVSCGGGAEDARYRNTEMLERPPILPTNRQAGDADCCDDAVIPKKRYKKGLGDDVYLTKSTPLQIKIKQPLENAWLTLGLALKQSEIRITDQERDKGLYYVAYHPGNILGAVSSWLKVEQKAAVYVLKVEPDGTETKVSAVIASAMEQNSALEKDRYDDDASDDAEDLLYNVFETLRDDLED
ncbi:MAG: outer membrane protein assembly factor BamC [Methylovulum sp.]|nr:MAG: outer membrane protein assembly factor BamC [Methylovulum sp.]